MPKLNIATRGNPGGGILDPRIKKIIDALAAQGGPPVETLTPAEARCGQPLQPYALAPASVAAVTGRRIPGPAGDIRVRVYTPKAKTPFPVLVFVHGGGWVCCDLDTHDEVARFLCRQAGCLVISVDYRRAPEAKFPAGLEDVLAVLEWAGRRAEKLGGDGQRVALGGDSAGGNLSLAAALRARDRKITQPVFLLLLYPVTDLASFNTASHRQYTEGYFLTRAQMEWFKGHYLNSPDEARDPLVSPLRAASFRRLPRTFILTAEFDPLRDEAEELARKMHAAGVPVKCTRYNGGVHALVSMAGAVPLGKQALEEAAGELKQAFRVGPPPESEG